MSTDIFVSVGRTFTDQQEEFVSSIENLLLDNDLNPRSVGRTDFSSVQPLKFIEELMNQCYGSIIIAFERIHIESGFEKRGGEGQKIIKNDNLTTVWNHIEAAMAYILHHPLLIIVEEGTREEGLLEGYDWFVQKVDIDASTLNSREFSSIFTDWKHRVEDYKIQKKEEDQEVQEIYTLKTKTSIEDKKEFESITDLDIESEIKVLESIYEQKQKESQTTFLFAVLAGLLGFLVIIAGIIAAYFSQVEIVVVSTVAGIVLEVTASLLLAQNKRTHESLDEVQNDLSRMRDLSRALHIVNTGSLSETDRRKQTKIILGKLVSSHQE